MESGDERVLKALRDSRSDGLVKKMPRGLDSKVGRLWFSTVRIAHRIAVVADGHVTELGTHDELLAARGRYAELFELQAAGYRCAAVTSASSGG